MFVSKKAHAAEVARLEALLSEAHKLQASLEARAAGAEMIGAQLEHQLKESELAHQSLAERAAQAEEAFSGLKLAIAGKMLAPVEFSSPGEAAFAGAKEEDGTLGAWSDANQDMWEAAALGAVLFTNQYKINQQLEYFKAGTPVPYSIEEEDGVMKVLTARLLDLKHGRIEIAVNGEYVRNISGENLEAELKWFGRLITLPPGYFC
ncbi:hypothetical protein [Pseudomonas sp. EMN2]|uniref:hypothetical protein n=1 Tax=Pseudomonas sp. EMN2 TaxID=2615212 RepID=UPI00129AA727|nr:hypothetical protein [Pseudomonas sp. EMN2]